MYQQINMYQPVFRRQRKIFSAATLLKIVALALLLLLAVYVQAGWTLHGLQTTAAGLTLNYRQLDARLAALTADNAAAIPNTAADEIQQLQAQVSARTSVLERIDRLALARAEGFGEIFEGLAAQAVPGLWLTGIRVDQNGETEIRGTTLDPQLVPRYLRLLHGQPRLAALHNGSVNLVRHAPAAAEIDFILSSSNQGELP